MRDGEGLVTGADLTFSAEVLETRRKKERILAMLLTPLIFIFIAVAVFYNSRIYKEHFKYDKAWIIGRSIAEVEERYGEFYHNAVHYDGASGEAAYYLYQGSSVFGTGLFSDNDVRYYYIKYDENGIVYETYVSLPKGG